MATLDIDDTTISYERTGRGPAMVFVHGMCGHADVWAEQARTVLGPLHLRALRPAGPRPQQPRLAPPFVPRGTPTTPPPSSRRSISPRACWWVRAAARSSRSTWRCATATCAGRRAQRAAAVQPRPRRRPGVHARAAPARRAAVAEGGLPAAVDAFFSIVCPGLWSMLDEARKDRFRDNADIGFTDLRSPPLEVPPADLAAVTDPGPGHRRDTSHPAFRSVARRLAGGLPDARFVDSTLRSCPLRRAPGRLRPRRVGVRRRARPPHDDPIVNRGGAISIDRLDFDDVELTYTVGGDGDRVVLGPRQPLRLVVRAARRTSGGVLRSAVSASSAT